MSGKGILVDSESVQRIHNCLGFVLSDARVHRNAELLTVNLLSDGHTQMIPLAVAFLLVRRDRVVYHRLYAE